MIDRWAFECYQSRAYTDDWDDDYRYRCPMCNNTFEYVSALLRHTESPACDAAEGKCLAKRVSEYEASE